MEKLKLTMRGNIELLGDNRFLVSIRFVMGEENYIADVLLDNDKLEDIFFFIDEGEDENGELDQYPAENNDLLKRNIDFVQQFVEFGIAAKKA